MSDNNVCVEKSSVYKVDIRGFIHELLLALLQKSGIKFQVFVFVFFGFFAMLYAIAATIPRNI